MITLQEEIRALVDAKTAAWKAGAGLLFLFQTARVLK